MDKSIDYTLCFVVVAINKIFKTVPKADAKKTHWNSNMNFVIKKKKKIVNNLYMFITALFKVRNIIQYYQCHLHIDTTLHKK